MKKIVDFTGIDNGKEIILTPITEQAKEAIKAYTGICLDKKAIPYSLYDGFMEFASKYNAMTFELYDINEFPNMKLKEAWDKMIPEGTLVKISKKGHISDGKVGYILAYFADMYVVGIAKDGIYKGWSNLPDGTIQIGEQGMYMANELKAV